MPIPPPARTSTASSVDSALNQTPPGAPPSSAPTDAFSKLCDQDRLSLASYPLTGEDGPCSGDIPSASMPAEDLRKLVTDLQDHLNDGAKSVGILGLTDVTLRLFSFLERSGHLPVLRGIYAPDTLPDCSLPVPIKPLQALSEASHDVLVLAEDARKEDLLTRAVQFIRGFPRVVLAGYRHYQFRDPVFEEEHSRLTIPSLANGYPNTLIHMYECLSNAARLDLHGVVAEFGMFRGGTTMLLSRLVERLHRDWPVIGFDTFAGFPPRRSVLDMYNHPDCVFMDVSFVREYLAGRNVEIVAGDIIRTVHRLEHEQLILSFFDTDNYTPARAALEVVRDRTVVGGAIVFDHFTGVNRFRYTLGERIAAHVLLDDDRYFHLHDTGVFFRQR